MAAPALLLRMLPLLLLCLGQIQVNLHVPVTSSAAVSTIVASNVDLTNSLSNPGDQELDFVSVHVPHVTLYLTSFLDSSVRNGSLASSAREALVQAYPHHCASSNSTSSFPIGTTKNASGSYCMLGVPATNCLSGLSMEVVLATMKYLHPSAKSSIPAWVNDLPENEREIKIDLIRNYGSPNVMSGFAPHLTLAVDDANPLELQRSFEQMPFSPLYSDLTEVGFGAVGTHGSVLRGKDYAPRIALPAADQTIEI